MESQELNEMSKDPQVVQGISPGEGARRAAESGPEKKPRYTARRKVESVMRLLRGEDLESLSRELQIPAAKTARWRKDFLDGGHLAMMGADTGEAYGIKRTCSVLGFPRSSFYDQMKRGVI